MGRLKQGQAIEIKEGGRVVRVEPAEYLGEAKQGRKICVLGDTKDSRAAASMVTGADVLVHECTNAHIDEQDGEGLSRRTATSTIPYSVGQH